MLKKNTYEKTNWLIIFLFGVTACENDSQVVKREYDLVNFQEALKHTAKRIGDYRQRLNSGRTSSQENISESDAQTIIAPLLNESRVLIESYGIDVMAEFGSLSNPDMVAGAISIYRMELAISSGASLSDVEQALDVTPEYQTTSSVYGCALNAAGVTVLIELARGGARYLSKQLAIKAIKKIAGKVLGPVGAAIAVLEFGDCMGWW
ncbi:MAG: hypothetical protein ACK514_15165 [Bacteroidota bacterium]|nr:hypothetical protein [Cytophagales bacterium]MCE2958208.1 hypothetical protein [Flammeovirgaceae bacterium]MCZ8071321.1 hypothetical protein [Cytophagales bacterium]